MFRSRSEAADARQLSPALGIDSVGAGLLSTALAVTHLGRRRLRSLAGTAFLCGEEALGRGTRSPTTLTSEL